MEGSNAAGGPSDQSSASIGDKTQDVVKYDTYSRVLSEKKRTVEENAALKAELDKYKQAELETTGKTQELVDTLRRQLDDERNARKKEKGTFAYKSVASQLESAARTAGCVHPDLVLKVADVQALQVNEDFSVNPDDVKRAIEETQNKYPELFRKNVEPPRDGTPGSSFRSGVNKVDLNKMSTDQIKELARTLYGNKNT